MADNLGLDLKQPISVWNKPLKVNFKDLFKVVGKIGVDVATQKWDGIAKDAVDGLAAIGLEGKTAGEQSWALIYNGLKAAIASLVSDSRTLARETPKDVSAIIEKLDLSLESSELEISHDFFKYPDQLSIIQEIQTPLRQFLEGVGVTDVQAEVLSDRLPTYFVFALHQEWQKNRQSYDKILGAFDSPFSSATEREQGWRLYDAWLQKQIKEPMLLEAFGLEDVYVSLRGYYRCERQEDDDDEDFSSRGMHPEYVRPVVDLEDYLHQWLDEANKNDAIRIISGGPGSGKSSFAKIFAARHAQRAAFPVLFVPLHHFEPGSELIGAVAEFVRYDENLKHNPLDPDDPTLRLLVIFDGLDELALQGKLSKEVAQEFVREVQAKVSQFNRSKTRLQVLFTGREVVAQESFKEPQQVLHVLPYFVPENQREKENGEPYQDEQKYLACDQRNEWWSKYSAATRASFNTLPNDLNRGNLTEITAQPLLNYLVALSYVQGKLTLSDATNLNTIYSDLLNAVYERGYEDNRKHAAIASMEKQQFIRVLEEIALAAWHGDGRTTTVSDIERHCTNSGLKQLLEIFEEGAKAGVTRLLAAFYFRQSGVQGSERTFEFTHKSFGEYLTACRIVRAMERIQKQCDRRQEDMEEGWDEREALLYWAQVCGPTRIDTYLLHFVLDEVALRPVEQVSRWQKTFSNLIGIMLRQGMPMEKIEPLLRFQQMNQWAIHAEEALLVALNACAIVTKKTSQVKWPSPEIFGAWIKRLQGQRVGPDNVMALNSLSYLDLSGTFLYLQDLQGANLQGAYLQGAILARTNLREAYLQEAHLQGAHLQGANLQEANLQEANLQEANLQGANLQGANLQEANLQGAILARTNLQRANLAGIQWDETNWGNVEGLETARNVPEALKQQLGLESLGE